MTKNDEGRVFPMSVELRLLLQEQKAERERLKRERGSIANKPGVRLWTDCSLGGILPARIDV
jgi:hypothetical protein